MQAGRLRHRVTIQRLTGAIGPTGGVADAWQDIGIRWASVKPLAGREWANAVAQQTEITHDVMLRADSLTRTLTPRDRLRFAGRTLDIQAVRNVDEDNAEMRLLCAERP